MICEVLEDVRLPSFDPDTMKRVEKTVAHKGDRVHIYEGPTYGCISPAGLACSHGGPKDTPFFEVPLSALAAIDQEDTDGT